MNTGDTGREPDAGEVTGQIRVAGEDSKRFSEQVAMEKRKVSRKLAALREKLDSRHKTISRPSR